jgi:hypothetical protein
LISKSLGKKLDGGRGRPISWKVDAGEVVVEVVAIGATNGVVERAVTKGVK